MTKVLVAGGGGREHALAWKLAHDGSNPEVFCAPGNAGTLEVAQNLPIAAEDVKGLLDWAKRNRPDLTVVGPEAPLCAGVTDAFEAAGLRVFGPRRDAARMEGSKVFSKDVMEAAGVPTAEAGCFERPEDALGYVRRKGPPLVVKAEGLAAGKGVLICATLDEAEAAVRQCMLDKSFGEAGSRVVVEEFLTGEEASILALVDGENVLMLASSQDHKRALDNDEGLNTGGMGAYSPAPVVSEDLWPVIREEVIERTLSELRRRDIVYRGVLYAGLMINGGRPKVLEFNCRFGDPETQAILPRIDGDLLPALQACAQGGGLSDAMIRWTSRPCVTVVMASGGYPGNYEKGKVIEGLQHAAALQNAVVFHAGTAVRDGKIVTSGGRVLGVTALGDDLPGAVSRAYEAVECIQFEGAHFRRDIAHRALVM